MPPSKKPRAKARGKSAASSSSSDRSSSHRQFSSGESSRLEPDSQEAHASSRAVPRRKQDLWIAPKTSLTRRPEHAAWSMQGAASSDARLLELADIALGFRKPQAFRRRRSQFLASQNERH